MTDAHEHQWPVRGYAPGHYSGKCTECGRRFEGDKRAYHCPECVIQWLLTAVRSAQAAAAPVEPSSTPPADAREHALREALREAEEVLRLVEHPSYSQRMDGLTDSVLVLGRHYGFGALMHEASFQWANTLEDGGLPRGGAFVAGPCQGTIATTLDKVRRALAADATAPGEEGRDERG